MSTSFRRPVGDGSLFESSRQIPIGPTPSARFASAGSRQALLPPRERYGLRPTLVQVPASSIILPTLNEAENLRHLLPRIMRAVPNCEIIVVDDGSTDGTAEVAERLGARVLRRGRKLGLASAVMDGFELSRAPLVGVLDADLSHPPELIPELLRVAEAGGIAVGSRYVEGGGVQDWPVRRRIMSRCAALAARVMLRLPVRDCMSGFFFAPRAAFERTRFRTEGFKILLNVLVDNGDLQVVEVPFTFRERLHGSSKLGVGEVMSYWKTLRALRG